MRRGGGSNPAAIAAVGIAAGLAGALLGASAHFARRVLTPAEEVEAEVEIVGVELSGSAPAGMRVWLRGPDSALEGRYSFIFDARSRESQRSAGHARLGPVVDRANEQGAERVARDVIAVDRGNLRVGARGRITGWWFTDPGELGFEAERIAIPLDDGEAEAWIVHPERPEPGRWAVHVHGRGALPEETLRGVAPLARAGVTSLVISYRNDPGAPPGILGRYGLGLAEWRDVDAAIAWAASRGASRVTLFGWSMGGTAAVLAGARAPRRSLVDGIVLDSPALDWPELLRAQARLAGAPALLATVGAALLRSGLVRGAVPWHRGTDIAALGAETLAAGLRVPVLIHASPEDSYVPWEGSLRVERLRPELVELRRATGEHVKLWNVDPEGWEEATQRFVEGLAEPPRP